MSFLGILKVIGTDSLKVLGVASGVAQVATPVLGLSLGPVASALLGKISTAITGAEALIQGAQQGAAKKQSVLKTLTQEIPQISEIIAEFGTGFTYDSAALSAAVDASVANYNAINAFVASFKATTATAKK